MSELFRRSRGRGFVVVLLAVGLLAAACGSDDDSGGSADKASIVVGSKDFAGAQVLSQIYGQVLKDRGYDVSFKDSIGPTEITYKALQNGDIDLYADYTGTLLTYLGGEPTGERAETYTRLKAKLAMTDIVVSEPSPAQDVNGFYVLKTTADKYKLTKISDLTAVAPQLTFGGPPECSDRPLCLGTKSQQLYNLKFKEVRKLDPGGPITNKALDDGTIDVGLLFTGSSVIKPTYVLLQDDKGLQPADNPVPVGKKATMNADVVKILDEINKEITQAEYNKMSLQVFNDKEDPADVATDFIDRTGLAK